MDFFLEILLTAILSLFFSFLVSKLSLWHHNSLPRDAIAENDPTSNKVEKPHIGVRDAFATKMNAPVAVSVGNFRLVDQNVETVDQYGIEADRVDELEEAATGNRKNRAEHTEAKSTVAVSPEIIIDKDMIVRGQDERSDSAGEIGAQREELMVRTTETVSAASVSPETVVVEEVMIQEQEGCIMLSESPKGRSGCVEVESEESGDAIVTESEEVRVEWSNTVEENEYKEEWKCEEEKEELVLEEDDDWEGIERSELEKAFTVAARLLKESGKAEEIGAEAKMELYGLHKIATEGSCREPQPMALMVSARARWYSTFPCLCL